MELKLLNVAKIENASLKLNGITVIAGNNNTGKTTIGKVVFSLFNSLVNIEEKVIRQKQNLIFQFLRRRIEQNAILGEENGYYTKMSPAQLRHYAGLFNELD